MGRRGQEEWDEIEDWMEGLEVMTTHDRRRKLDLPSFKTLL